MKKLICPIVIALSTLCPMGTQAEVSVEPVGMKIVWKSLKKEFDGFQTYNSSEGAYITLAVHGGEKGIIGFDKDKSKLTISDGTADLGGKFSTWNKTSKDGKVMRIEVSSEKLPAADAATLTLTGNLEITVASKTETKSNKPQELKKGDIIKMTDDFSFEIKSIGKPEWGDAPFEVVFKWKRKIPELAAVRFYDNEGKEIESSKGSSSRSGFLGKYTVTQSYNLKKKSDILKIEMDLWVDAQKITVPVKTTVGAGGMQK